MSPKPDKPGQEDDIDVGVGGPLAEDARGGRACFPPPRQSDNEPASVALQVLASLAPSIPATTLASARGLLITRTHRAALGFGIQTGTAVALRRIDASSQPEATSTPSSSSSSSSSWSAPLVFAVRRASFGVSYGYATVDSVLLLRTDEEARLLAAGAPAFGTEHRFVSSILDGDDDDDDDNVEVEVEGSSLERKFVRAEAAGGGEAGVVSGEAGVGSGEAGVGCGETSAAARAAGATTPSSLAPPPPPPASSSGSLAALLFSRSSGALVDMSVVAGMLSLDSAAHEALYCSSAAAGAIEASSATAAATAAAAPRPPPPEPEDVLAGKAERPAAFASVYELLEKMERGQQSRE